VDVFENLLSPRLDDSPMQDLNQGFLILNGQCLGSVQDFSECQFVSHRT